MIQESYVTFEQAKVLKEVGFPQPFIYNKELNYYVTRNTIEQIENNEDCIGSVVSDCDNEDGWSTKRFKSRGYILCPTSSLVQKWLREEKELYISIVPTFENRLIKASGYIVDINYRNSEGRFVSTEINNNNSYIYQDFETYEQALSAGIDKCIELLKQ